ncbi:hypothetical protein [Thermodesulfobacterium sp. TA1]|uniref:hypothetical protein n=1 Tax=Thermodesulfobacterium sp. TA1 TaxID=2234087 RepID=UPI00143E0AD3|nr:hypothetical protein [Thermodesulfobacterium sp. TA1]
MKTLILTTFFIFVSLVFSVCAQQHFPTQIIQQIAPFKVQQPEQGQPQTVQPQAQPLQVPSPALIPPAQLPQPVQITVFGEQLFLGRFATEQFAGFNPDYQIAIGDIITVRIWGLLTTKVVSRLTHKETYLYPMLVQLKF